MLKPLIITFTPVYYLLVFTTLAVVSGLLELDFRTIAVGLFGSFSGVLLLAYFKRLDDKWEELFRGVAGTVGALICGSAGVVYLEFDQTEYKLFFYFANGFVIFSVTKALLAIGDGSLKGMLETIGYKLIDAFVPGRNGKKQSK